MLLLRFHPHESAWWAPLNRFYAGLAGITETCIGPILRVLQSGIRAQQLRYPTSPACRITQPTAKVECQNYFRKIGWIVLIRSDFTPYPSAALLSPLRVLNPLSSLSSSPGFLVVGFSRTFRVSLPPLITVFLHPVLLLFEWSFICGTILCSVFVPPSVFRRYDIIYTRSDAESASLLCF